MGKLKKIWESSELNLIKIFLIAFVLMIGISKCNRYLSKPIKIITYKIKVYYNNGKTEFIYIKKPENVIYNHSLYNGCLYRTKREANTIFDETNYDNAIRCGVKFYKTISVKKSI